MHRPLDDCYSAARFLEHHAEEEVPPLDAYADPLETPEEAAPVPPVTGVAEATLPRRGKGAELLDDVEAHLGTYVAFPGEHERVAATLWVAHAHDVDAFESTPRLALLSPEPGSGKTRALEVIETMVPEPMHVLSASTAAIFRTIATERPTLLLDEVDAIFGRRGNADDNEDLRALLNAGHRNGATIPRCVGPTHEVKRFPVYTAVALAGLGDLPDTLMTRSVVVRMRRRAPHEQVKPFRARLDMPLGHLLRDRLAWWATEMADRLRAIPAMPEGVDDRPADVWEPLLAVADAAGGHWPQRGRAACLALAGASMSREASLGIRLLTDLRAIFGDAEKMPTADILDQLHALEEAPWAELRGRPLDARGLAWRLGQYGISSTTLNLGGDDRAKGYKASDLRDAWARYVPSHPGDGVTPVTAVPSTEAGTEVTEVTDLRGGEGGREVGPSEGMDETPPATATRPCRDCGQPARDFSGLCPTCIDARRAHR